MQRIRVSATELLYLPSNPLWSINTNLGLFAVVCIRHLYEAIADMKQRPGITYREADLDEYAQSCDYCRAEEYEERE